VTVKESFSHWKVSIFGGKRRWRTNKFWLLVNF
jgi:hypothetical protein